MKPEEIKKKIFALASEYYSANFNKKIDSVPVSGKKFDDAELIAGIDAVLDGWWTEGRFSDDFSKQLLNFLKIKNCILVNSGSSANLVALTSLTSHLIEKEKRLMPGDEVITVAAGFPTTVNPIVMNGCIPVFVDIDKETLNIDASKIEPAISDRTKAIFVAHTLGNPANLTELTRICNDHSLWLVEDSCDALGSTYNNKPVGTFGDIATLSFYPAHHITTGEGGAVLTNNSTLAKAATSIRDWGRDCWCRTGQSNSCGKRFTQKHGDLPYGYDHKYVYSHIGYNMKMTDLQAAIGSAQMKKLPGFIKAREKNFRSLLSFFKGHEDAFVMPRTEKNSKPSWFGFPLTIREGAGVSRQELLVHLDRDGIGSRLVFGGNLTKQPYFLNYNIKYRTHGQLKITDLVMDNSFWIGVHPGLTPEMLEKTKDSFSSFLK